ncbi:hypothetical protein V3C99_018381, partial [Haemonchus contortus]
MGEKYIAAINILKKHYDRSASIADILINEIERLPRAQGNPRSCRETLEAISSRVIHLEQTGISMNADRMWRRLILSKFTESICGTVIRKESEAGNSFDVNEIIESIDKIITLQETTELTTRTFGFDQSMQGNNRSQQERYSSNITIPGRNMKTRCLCGETHLPQRCNKFVSPEERRTEARRQRRNIKPQRNQPASGQHVPQIASAQIFDEYQMDYRTVTLLLDSRARRSFIKSSFAASLKLPSHSATSSTAAGMGKLRKTSQSDEIRITLKSHRGSKELKHIPVFTKEKLIAPTRTAKLSEVDRCFVTKNTIPMAQRSFNPANVYPDILIGQDLLHRILDHNSAVIRLPSGLI